MVLTYMFNFPTIIWRGRGFPPGRLHGGLRAVRPGLRSWPGVHGVRSRRNAMSQASFMAFADWVGDLPGQRSPGVSLLKSSKVHQVRGHFSASGVAAVT